MVEGRGGGEFAEARRMAFRNPELFAAVMAKLEAATLAYLLAQPRCELVGVTTVLMHESGATVTGTLHLRPSKSDPQGVGSAVTYARRYALLAMTGAAPEDDDGNSASGPREQPRQTRREEPRASAAVQAAGVAIDLCDSEAVLAKWSASNADMIAKLDPADKAEVRRLYGLRLEWLRKQDAAQDDGDPFEEAA
jgi:hypothetical protein